MYIGNLFINIFVNVLLGIYYFTVYFLNYVKFDLKNGQRSHALNVHFINMLPYNLLLFYFTS